MTVPNRLPRRDAAPALYRLLAESALSRSALGACGIPLALLDAADGRHPLTYVNAAFEAFFGYRECEALGRSVASLLLRGDEALLQRMLVESPKRWQISAWTKDGSLRHVEGGLAGLRDAAGRLTHWIIAFSDREEVEKLRAEVESLKSLAAASLGVRLETSAQPTRGAQEPRVEIPTADELHAHRQIARILQQR